MQLRYQTRGKFKEMIDFLYISRKRNSVKEFLNSQPALQLGQELFTLFSGDHEA